MAPKTCKHLFLVLACPRWDIVIFFFFFLFCPPVIRLRVVRHCNVYLCLRAPSDAQFARLSCTRTPNWPPSRWSRAWSWPSICVSGLCVRSLKLGSLLCASHGKRERFSSPLYFDRSLLHPWTEHSQNFTSVGHSAAVILLAVRAVTSVILFNVFRHCDFFRSENYNRPGYQMTWKETEDDEEFFDRVSQWRLDHER